MFGAGPRQLQRTRSSKLKSGTSPIVEQLFGMQNICTHSIVFELCAMEKKEEVKERKKMNKTENFKFSFLQP